MEASKPPLLCPVCGEPIWHGDEMTLAHPMVDDGEGGQRPAPDQPPIPVHTPCFSRFEEMGGVAADQG